MTPKSKGRPRLPKGEATKVYSVCLQPGQAEYIDKKYSNLSEAIRLLAKGGKYEQLINENDLLTIKLREIQG